MVEFELDSEMRWAIRWIGALLSLDVQRFIGWWIRVHNTRTCPVSTYYQSHTTSNSINYIIMCIMKIRSVKLYEKIELKKNCIPSPPPPSSKGKKWKKWHFPLNFRTQQLKKPVIILGNLNFWIPIPSPSPIMRNNECRWDFILLHYFFSQFTLHRWRWPRL